MRIVVSLITLWVFAFTVGCQANPLDTETPLENISSPVSPPTENTTQMPSSLPLPDDAGLHDLIEKAKTDLAGRLAISVNEFILVEAKRVVWPDSSMGCPQPGMAYLKILEDGALIVLLYEGNSYEYHNGGSRGLFLCETTFKDPRLDLFNLTPSKSDPPPTTPDNSIPPGEDT